MSLYKRTYLFVAKYKLFHPLFWFVYLLLIAYLLSPSHEILNNLQPALFVLSLHMLVAYINIYFFIPHLLYNKRYLIYIVALVLLNLLVCFPLAIIVSIYFPDNQFLAYHIWTPFFFVANTIYFLMTVFLTSFIYIVSEWYRNQKATKELERMNTENELKYLKSQINPHFLFNSLNSLYALTLIKSDKASEMVESLSNVLRYVLYETAESKVPLEQEITYLKNLIKVEKIRTGDRLNAEMIIKGDISSVYIEPLLFINFVENSLKHGVNNVLDPSWIKISIMVDEQANKLIFRIENSKPNTTLNDKKAQVGGIGLINVKKRLKLLYPNKHTLQIQNNQDHFLVNLKLELN